MRTITSLNFLGYVNDITEKREAEQKLKDAAAEKEALHRELLHRVKNSFNQLKMIVFFERMKLEDKQEKESIVLENLETRIGTIADMYSLLNASGVSSSIDLGKYLDQIVITLKDSYLKNVLNINISTNMASVETTPKIASSVGLIINELLTNSLKYAFPKNKDGNIFVVMNSVNGNVEIEFADDGLGLPKDFDIENSSGMGLQLVNMLVKQLRGNLTYETKNGTHFKLTFSVE